jgi:hypothetical protein
MAIVDTGTKPEAATPAAEAAQIAAGRARTLDALERCIVRLVDLLDPDHSFCGKAACRRSRRCRGFACGRPADGEAAACADGTQR